MGGLCFPHLHWNKPWAGWLRHWVHCRLAEDIISDRSSPDRPASCVNFVITQRRERCFVNTDPRGLPYDFPKGLTFPPLQWSRGQPTDRIQYRFYFCTFFDTSPGLMPCSIKQKNVNIGKKLWYFSLLDEEDIVGAMEKIILHQQLSCRYFLTPVQLRVLMTLW